VAETIASTDCIYPRRVTQPELALVTGYIPVWYVCLKMAIHPTTLLSLTYKVLTTTQPPYLYNLNSVQRPRSTRSSSVITFARPPITPFVMLHLVSGINPLYLFVNLILVPVPPFPTHLFLYPSLLPLLVHHSVHP